MSSWLESRSKYSKDYKLLGKRKLAIDELDNVIEMLANDEPLDVKYCDHPLHCMNSIMEYFFSQHELVFLTCIFEEQKFVIA